MRAVAKIDDDGALRCPRCGDNYMHHKYTTVYDRGEDNQKVMRTDILPGSLTREHVQNETSGNPSSRRDAVVIVFYCEHCHAVDAADPPPYFYLNLVQHKGITHIEWDYE